MAKKSEVTWISSEPVRRAKSAIAVTVSVVVLLSVISVVGVYGYNQYTNYLEREDYIGTGEQPIQVVVDKGWGWGKVADTLLVKGVIKDPDLFRKEALKLAEGPSPGTWNLMTHLPAETAAQMMMNTKNRLELRLTVPEGRRLVDIFPIMIKELGITQSEIDQAIEAIKADPKIIGLHPDAASDLEGFLFPDTYLLYPPIDTDALSVFEKMANQFNLVAEETDLEKKAKALGITVKEAVIIASIVDAEVLGDDQPKAARVIFNRLAKGMELQMDTVVLYGLGRNDVILSIEQTEIDTPYNVYMYKGLPPTAINCPGRDALDAAVNPQKGKWLFWTTINLDTGETNFENNEAQHEASRKQLAQWCDDNPGKC